MNAELKKSSSAMAEKPGLKGFPVKSLLRRALISEHFVLYLSIVWFIAMIPVIPGIISSGNLNNLFGFIWPLLAVCIGQTVVLIVAGIDLSQISVIGLTSVIGALFMSNRMDPNILGTTPLWGKLISEDGGILANSVWAIPAGIFAMLVVGSLVGTINGVCIARFKMPPFMVTLVTQLICYYIAVYITQSNNIMGMPDGFVFIGDGKLGGIVPVAFLITALLCIAVHILLSRTVLGKWLYSIGTNTKASIVSGVPHDKVIIFAYALSGFCAAFASVIYSGRLMMGRPTLGQEIFTDVIGATIIGGTSLFGGKGKVSWTVFGVLFFILLTDVLNLLNLQFYTINIVKGLIILIAAIFDVARTRIVASENRIEKAGA